jgi:hypothetical protein
MVAERLRSTLGVACTVDCSAIRPAVPIPLMMLPVIVVVDVIAPATGIDLLRTPVTADCAPIAPLTGCTMRMSPVQRTCAGRCTCQCDRQAEATGDD